VLTEWPEFQTLDWAKLATYVDQAVIVDTRNLLDERRLGDAGFAVVGTGRACGG
ncbi:UDP binding domain-containing protein, partial [Nocardia tenerifensis]